MTIATRQDITKTIIAQLGGWSKLSAMANARDLICLDANESRVGGAAFKLGRKFAYVELAADDTYTVRVGRIVKYDFREKSSVSGVLTGQLRGAVESATGLHLSM